MKKSIFVGVALGAFVFSFSGLKATEVLTEVKAAYFHPESTKFRDIYGSAGMYGAEVSVQTWCNWYTWVSGDFFIKSGHSLGLRDDTNIYFIPIGLGFKYFFPFCDWDFYLGGGALGTYVHIHDHSPFVVPVSTNWGWGAIGKAGAMWTFHSFFLDLFTSYSYTHVGFHEHNGREITRHDANLGGWAIGGGIGYRFGCRD